MNLIICLQHILNRIASTLNFAAPLMARIYLAPVFITAGLNKYNGFDSVVEWFGNPDWGLGLPLPWLNAFLATSTELVGGVLLLFGLGTRWISIPLMATMLVAIFAVHFENGWQAVLDPMSPWAPEHAADGVERLERAKDILREHGNYDWLTEYGSLVTSNNGIEWGVTYFVLLALLFTTGAGKISIDHLLKNRFIQS